MKKIFLILLSFSFVANLFSQTIDVAKTQEIVSKYSKQLGLSENDMKNYIVSSSYKSDGIQYIYLLQSFKGLPVRNQMKVFSINTNDLSSNVGNFIPNVSTLTNAASKTPLLNAKDAVNAAFESEKIARPLLANSFPANTEKFDFGQLNGVTENVTGELMWYPILNNDKVVAVKLIWAVVVAPKGTDNVWQIILDANNGNVINKFNLSISESFTPVKNSSSKYDKSVNQIYKNYVEQNSETASSPSAVVGASYLVIPYPAESPSHVGGTAAVRTNPWTAAVGPASAFGWHSNGTTDFNITRGNNVWATEGTADGSTTYGNTGNPATSTTGPDPLTFNFIPNYTSNPTSNPFQQFALTNLFYWNNVVHDITYQYGFNEVSGNFQQNNQGLGGLGNDHVIAVAQSAAAGPVGNNANFSTPVDGGRPRMRMYLFNSVTPPNVHVNTPSTIGPDFSSIESGFSTANKLANLGPVTGQVIYFNDDAAGSTHFACGAPTNSITGKIALIDRGNGGICTNPTGVPFTTKVLAAQNAGAIAVIMVNNVAGAPIIMGGGPDNTIVIPAVMVSQSDGAILAGQLSNNLNVTLSAGTNLDGDLDNGVIVHEFGHGISNRLTGGPANSSCLQNAEQGGEGWSDYIGLMLTTDWSTVPLTDGVRPRPIGTYVGGQSPVTGAGIRNFPYSTNLSVNSLTYANVGTGTIGTEVHNIGEVWCMAIWEMTWAIIAQENAINPNLYNFTTATNGGNSIALKLVLEGMKLQPCSPGFIDARDAILAADRNLYAGRHACSMWTAFAKRGMGYSALQGSSASATDQTAATDMPPAPIINTQPVDITVAVAANATFTANAGTDVNLINNWQVSTNGGTTWNNVIPATITPTLTLTNVSAGMNGYKYRAQIFIGCAITVSSVVTLTVTGGAAPPIITTQPVATTVCSGATATFTAAATGATSYVWEQSTNGGTTWIAVTPAATTATLTLTAVTIGMNNNLYRLVSTNGTGSTISNSALLTVTITPAAPTITSPVIYCQGATTTALTATGNSLLWYTVATGGTGIATAPTPNTATAGSTIYYVSQTTGTCESPRASITVTVNPTPVAPTVSSPLSYCQNATAAPLTASGSNLLWYLTATGGTGSTSAPTPSTTTVGSTIYYVSQTTVTCEGPRASITVNITATPAAPTVTSPIQYCQNVSAVPLTASGSNLLWYTTSSGGTGSTTAPTPSTSTVGSTIYYVSQTTGCESPRASITINVVAGTPAPTTTSTSISYCQGATATQLSATGSNLLWYTTTTGGMGSTTAPTPGTATAGTTTYYVSQTSGSCESPRLAITVTVTATPAAPAVTTPVNYCQNAAATPLTAGGSNLLWYTIATGGTGSTTAPTPNTATIGTTTFYVSQSTGACEGPRASIIVNVSAVTAAPTVSSPVTYCQGATATALTASGTGLLWYTASTGGTGSTTAPTPSTTTVGSTTYYVSQTSTCGESPRASIVVNINATPAAPTIATPVTYCQGATATALTATGTGLLWYSAATGGTGTATAPTPSTATAGTTNYYVSQTTGSCEGPRALIAVTVIATPAAPTVSTPVTYCQNAATIPLTATGTNLLWFTTATGGTGATTAPTPSSATIGSLTYYVSQSTGICQSSRAAITVTIIAIASAPTVISPVTYCQNATTTPLTATGSNLLWYTTVTGGTGSTTAPTPSTITVGSTTYYVSQTVNGCESQRAAIVVTINLTPAAPAVTATINYCQGGTATALTATGSNLSWYTTATGGTVTATAPTPSTATAGTTIYYVSQTSGACESPRAAIAVTVSAGPAITVQPVDITSCTTTASFSVTATGTNLTYLWQVSTDGGITYSNIATAINSSYTVSGLTPAQANNKYRVIVSAAGCSSATSNAVTAKVGTAPTVILTAAPTVNFNPAINGGLYITVSPVGNYTYQWKRNNTILPLVTSTSITKANGLLDEFGTYQVTVTDISTGCSGVSNTVSVSDIAGERVRLFLSPNPTRDIVKVSYYSSSTVSQVRMVSVYDSKGGKLITKQMTVSGNYGSGEVDLSKMNEGTYLFILRDAAGKKIASDRVIKY